MVKKYIITFIAGFVLATIGAGIGAYYIIGSNKTAYAKLASELKCSQSEVTRLGTLVIRSDDIIKRENDIVRREESINKREREIASREADNNRRAEEIYSDLRDIVSASYSDLDALDLIANLIKKLE